MTLGLLLLRLLLGLTLAAHGSQKLFGWFGGGGLEGTGVFFETHLGFRPGRRNALMAAAAEFGGGLLLVLGFLTPLAAACVIGTMVVAGISAHGRNGFFITKGGYEYTVVLGGIAAALAFVGPGRLSFDHALGWDLWGNVWGVAAIVIGCAAGAFVLSTRGRQVEGDDTTVDLTDEVVEGGREVGLERSEAAETEASEA